MHEASLMSHLIQTIEAIAQEQNATKILAVKVRLGALSHFSPEHFTYHFVIASQHTLMESARLEIETSDDLTDPIAQDVVLESLDMEINEALQS
ncbi:hydrogenase maturation nickel metallochaperone HypA [Leptolyngbya boryana CZ1]|uniref:Hydrogenase maturation nickel metallochaperone HypA n=1 Tax=Leptolyngbya boryana CZ1 TaxID=3060204 RepID=A0AA97AYG2_LEPBY|nr:hydrogenase maturation nickel metallochaperone HypA [Leptolyngbya boryana]WNZ48356.1 hydrogenase maturation nickel metallochaperone HypA [Leptolyngbya boryana CZ1]